MNTQYQDQNNDLISRSWLLEQLGGLGDTRLIKRNFIALVNNAPIVDAVTAEKYDALREAFVDYVCSGVSNPAPYCKNRCAECVDGYGLCRSNGENCAGFDPDKEG